MIEKLLPKLRARDSLSAVEETALREGIAEVRDYPADKTFVREGELLNFSTLLIEGLVCRYKDLSGGERQIAAIHVPGDFVDLHSFSLKRLDHSIMTLSPCKVGIESTVVSLLNATPRILRPGGITAEQLGEALQMTVEAGTESGPLHSPGQLESHYAPTLPLRLNADSVGTGEALLAFGSQRAEGWRHAAAFLNLSVSGDLREAASNLFAYMQDLDRSGARTIAVEPIPFDGLGEAINDRLSRAAAPRDNTQPTT